MFVREMYMESNEIVCMRMCMRMRMRMHVCVYVYVCVCVCGRVCILTHSQMNGRTSDAYLVFWQNGRKVRRFNGGTSGNLLSAWSGLHFHRSDDDDCMNSTNESTTKSAS